MALHKLKERVGRKVLEQRMLQHKQKRTVVSFPSAKHILLAFSMKQTEQELAIIEQFAAQLKEMGKKVTRLIYLGKLNRKEVKPGDIAGTVYISNEDFNLWGMPVSAKSKDILSTPFDYVINLNMESPMQLCSMTACSKASLRIGPYKASDLACYDLMLGSNKQSDLKHYIRDLNHYIPKL
ncbi:MAG: hypothetical protein RL160_2047 [Bacteroidota bacterium]|jgi:hypothetical protein